MLHAHSFPASFFDYPEKWCGEVPHRESCYFLAWGSYILLTTLVSSHKLYQIKVKSLYN